MAEPISDKIQAETVQPIVVNPVTVDEYKDASMLKPVELSQGDNIVMDDGIIEKIKGTLKYNSDTANTPVTGLHRAYGKDGTKKLIRLSNGNLQTAGPAYATSLLTGLSTTKITPFIDIHGRAYGVNQTDGIVRVDPIKNTAVKTGIVNPYLRKKIAFFESDESWVENIAPAVKDTDHYRSDEWSGNSMSSLKVSGTTGTASMAVTMDLTVFDNGKVSGDDDLISFKVMTNNKSALTYVVFGFNCPDGTNYKSFYLYSSDFPDANYEWKEFNIKKSAFFNTGTTNWATVTSVICITIGTAACSVWFDSMFLKSAKPIAVEMRRQIAKCSSSDGFTEVATDVIISNDEYTEDYSSLKFLPDGNETLTAEAPTLSPQVDLSTWPNGVASDTTDEIVFKVMTTNYAQLAAANALTIRLGQSSTVYWEAILANAAAIGVSTRNNQWIEVRIAKSAFSAGATGITTWLAIDYLAIIIDFDGACSLWIDDIHMEPYQAKLQLATFDEAETTKWAAFAGTTLGGFKSSSEGGVEGTHCLMIAGAASAAAGEGYSEWYVDWTAGTGKNLTLFGVGIASTVSDYISLYIKCQKGIKNGWITEVELMFDAADGVAFTTAYRYIIPLDLLDDKGKYINIKKSDFDEIGAPIDWSTIGGAKIKVTGKGADNKTSIYGGGVYFDDMKLIRSIGQTGRYYYKYAFMVKDVYSSCSEISEKVDTKGSYVVVSNVATSADTRVTSRAIFRLGGAYTSTWMLVGKIEDNTTTEFVDDVDDTDLVYALGDDVPQGFINNVPCANIGYDPQVDRAIYWGDPTYKNRIYYSHAGFYHVVDEWGYREMQDDIMYVQPWYGQNIVVFKNGKKKITGDVATGEIVDLPVTTGACSYYACKKATMNILVCVGQDNVYVFDGYKDIPVGDPIKNYLKDRESYQSYINMGYHRDTVYVSVRSGVTPTYNNKVLRYHIPTKSWTIIPNWNANVFCNFDKQDDNNEFMYGDSVTKNVFYACQASNWQFNAAAISSVFATGWINDPKNEIAIHHIELKARGTLASVLTIEGYINYGASATCTGTITFPATDQWRTYRIGPKNIWNLLRGDALKVKFTHSTNSSYFKVKDIVVFLEKLSKRITLNEVTVT